MISGAVSMYYFILGARHNVTLNTKNLWSLTVNEPKNGLDLYSWTKIVANAGSHLKNAVSEEHYLSPSLLVYYRNVHNCCFS